RVNQWPRVDQVTLLGFSDHATLYDAYAGVFDRTAQCVALDRDFDSIDDRGRRDVEAEVVGMKIIGVAAARRSLRVGAIIGGGIARGCPCHSAERDIVVR